jgi:hypothetical protein
MESVIPQKKVVIPHHSEVYGRANSEVRNGMEWHETNWFLQKILLQQTELAACFCPGHSSERTSELVSLPRNGLERNAESLLLFFFHGTEFLAFSPLWNDSERNFESFLFRGTAGIPPEQTNYSVYSVFRGTIFLSKLPTLLSAGTLKNLSTVD